MVPGERYTNPQVFQTGLRDIIRALLSHKNNGVLPQFTQRELQSDSSFSHQNSMFPGYTTTVRNDRLLLFHGLTEFSNDPSNLLCG